MEGAFALFFMGSDGSGPYRVEGTPGNGALPVSATLNPLALQNVNLVEVLNNPTLTGGLAGLLAIGGPGAAGAAVDGSNPLKVAGSDGAALRVLHTDAAGNLIVSPLPASLQKVDIEQVLGAAAVGGGLPGLLATAGPGAAGAALDASNPLKVAGSDGANLRTLLTDTSGRQVAVGAAANGAAPSGSPLLAAGWDGALVHALLTDASGRQVAVGAAAAGAAPAGNPVLAAGSDGALVHALLTDATGALFDRPAKAATYSAVSSQSVTGAGILFQLKGSATKTIRVTRVMIDGISGASAEGVGVFIRRDTAAATGGTPVATAIAVNDSADPASTAVATAFTTPGAAPGGGTAAYTYNMCWNPSTQAPASHVELQLGGVNSRTKEMILHGVNEYLMIITGNSLGAGSGVNITVEWIEE